MGENVSEQSDLAQDRDNPQHSSIQQLRQQLEHTEENLRFSQEQQTLFIKKLKKARRDFLAIFDSVPAMIWYRDRDGKILRANRCAADSIAMTVKELVGRNYYELFPDDVERSRGMDLQVMQTGCPICGQLRQFTTFDGKSIRWALVDRFPLRDRNGRIEGVMVFAQDITEKKEAQDRLIRAQKEIELKNEQLRAAVEKAEKLADSACKSNQAKSEILASSSHDLRTPMNAIIGFTDLLLETSLDNEQRQYVTTIRDSAGGLLALINDILDFARLEAGKLKIDIVPCFVGEFLGQIRAMMETSAQRKGLEFKIITDPRLPPSFYTDPLRLKQCLINLIGNAIKFTETGHVFLYVSGHQQSSGPCIRFDVEDTGIGIPQDKQEEIFKIFSQADVSTSRKYGGSGLGLTITQKLTDLLGGTISISSRPDCGSKFSVILPLLNQPVDFQRRLTVSPDNRRAETVLPTGLKILLAQSGIPSQLTMNLLLRRNGMDVRAVSSVDELMQQLSRDSFDLLLLDAMLAPSVIDLIHVIRKQGGGAPILVLVNAENKNQQEIVQTGAGILPQPISRRSLYQAVAEQIKKGKEQIPLPPLDTKRQEQMTLVGETPDPQEMVALLAKLLSELQEALSTSDHCQIRQVLAVVHSLAGTINQPRLADKAGLLMQQIQGNVAGAEEIQAAVNDIESLCRGIFNASAQ